MVDIDQAMAAIPSQATAEPSEPAKAPEETKPVEAGTAQPDEKQESGSAEPTAKDSETKGEGRQKTPTAKSEYAFIKLKDDFNKKLRARDEGIASLTKALEQFSGLKFDKEKGDIESYVNLLMQKRDLEASKKALEEDTELGEMQEQLKDFQAKEIYGHDPKALELYENSIKPKRKALYDEIAKLDKTGAVLQYLNASRRAPLLEVAFISKGGQQLFAANVTEDPYVTKRNLERLENEMFNAVQSHKDKQQTQPAPVSTPSVNDGSALTKTAGGPSLDDVAKWF